MRRFLIPIVTVCALATPATAKILTVCGGSSPQLSQSLTARPFAALAYAAPGPLLRSARTALSQDDVGYDIRLNWGEPGEVSLRSVGAAIGGGSLGDSLVHLMVARPNSLDVEHFLFALDQDGSGELLKGSGEEGTADDLARLSCSAP